MATIFTKIIEGKVPAHKIAENDTHLAFLDINPTSEGHTLVVPKQEIDYFFDLSDDLLTDTMLFAKKVAAGIDDALDTIRTGIIVEGMEVPHAHVHLIPIYRNGQPFSLGHQVDVDDRRMKELAGLISDEVQL